MTKVRVTFHSFANVPTDYIKYVEYVMNQSGAGLRPLDDSCGHVNVCLRRNNGGIWTGEKLLAFHQALVQWARFDPTINGKLVPEDMWK